MVKPAQLKRAPLPVLSAFFLVYIFVSGGSFGIEEMVSSAGPGLTVLLLLILPLFWALPMALVSSELGSAITERGGFYVWARRALGDFWGFQTAWWWSLATLVDTSLYLVLCVSYLQGQLDFDSFSFYLICWFIIGLFAAINILGIRFISLASTFFSLLIIFSFLALTYLGFTNWQFNPFIPLVPPGKDLFGGDGALMLGLGVGLWMFSGYESMSTLSGEIRNPQYVIPRALMLALPFVSLMYILPTIASLAAFGQWERFGVTGLGDEVSFIDVGRSLGGDILGYSLLAAALVGNLALYLDYMGSSARPLFALADDGFFPKFISHISPRFGTPVRAILLVALVNSVLIIGPFQNLVIIDVILMISAYALIFIAAVRLRMKEPDLKRPFRIPLGTIGVAVLVVSPLSLIGLMLYLTLLDQSVVFLGITGFDIFGVRFGWLGIVGVAALLTGPFFFWTARVHLKKNGGAIERD